MQSVSFSKGQATPLDGVTELRVGAAWDRKTAKQSGWARKLAARTGGKINVGGGEKDIDLDLGVVLYRDGEPKRVVIGHNVDPVNGTVVHSGDNQTGEGSGDDETVTMRLASMPAWIDAFAVAVFAYKNGTNFDNAQNVSLNVYDASATPAVLVDELMPTLGTRATGVVVLSGTKDLTTDVWSVRVVDQAGRLARQQDDAALFDFVKRNAGL